MGDRYRVVRFLADGGMGSVFEAENTWTQRRVAVKLLLPELGKSADRVQRFLREARSATKIDHPNIVDVLDMGEDKPTGALFLVQELLKGRDLRHHLDQKPGRRIDAKEASQLLVPILEALEAAHQLGVLHRDIKPANIYLAKHGNIVTPKLIDFGLSKLMRRDGEVGPQTGGGVPIGTPHYMSPEQARGDRELDGRSDVWSMGVVFYECLTGRPPFDAPNLAALLVKVASERPKPVDERADVPAELAAIVHRALEPEIDRRWGSMTEMLHALRDSTLIGKLPALAPLGTAGPISGTFRLALAVDDERTEVFEEDIRRAMMGKQTRINVAPTVVERLPWVPVDPPPPPSVPPVVPRSILQDRIRFGLVLATRGDTDRHFVRGLSKQLGKGFKIAVARSYADLVDALAEGELELAWLPPVAYVRALRSSAARLMLTLERDGRRSYSAALVGRDVSSVSELEGNRVAWVDPWSAAGYLVPRCMMRFAGFEPDKVFSAQSFHGSYEKVLEAIVDGTADVGAMFCRVSEQGDIVGGAFRDDSRVRAIAVSAEPIPGDTICATNVLDLASAREAIDRFVEMALGSARASVQEIFGTDRFVAANASRYEGLEAALVEDLRPAKP
ncbi:MAG: protein kinase domain-containing protein [Polyangiales bacterium]